jgi:hypothetical protein
VGTEGVSDDHNLLNDVIFLQHWQRKERSWQPSYCSVLLYVLTYYKFVMYICINYFFI